jgi:hypothetical protein
MSLPPSFEWCGSEKFWRGASHRSDEFAMLEHYAVLCGDVAGITMLMFRQTRLDPFDKLRTGSSKVFHDEAQQRIEQSPEML